MLGRSTVKGWMEGGREGGREGGMKVECPGPSPNRNTLTVDSITNHINRL